MDKEVEINEKPGDNSNLSTENISKISRAFGMVSHFICALFTGFVVYTAWPGSSLFSWHPTLMTIAFALLVAEALFMFSPESSLALKSPRSDKIKYHWILHTLALVFGSLGFFAIFYNKVLNDKLHFQSWHGRIGLITIVYFSSQCLAGSTLLYPNFMKFIRLADKKLYHATSGTVLFALLNLSLVLGMCSSWFTTQVTGTAWYACILCPLLTTLMVTIQVSNAYIRTKKVSRPKN
ncbi:transmembrane reductase CYB561D2-like [Lineus longissimus]|uniref:transmembrane reductase CYB561D2-like n=1 Tax=Lineus longissimus TaxID=88925 RepID=UPI002B4DA43B